MSYTENKKADGLDALTSLAADDLIIVADTSDSSRAKKITKANLATDLNTSPVFTGNPTAPTPSASDNSTKIATTAYVDGGIATAIAGASITIKSGIATRDVSTASGTQTIAHGLGKTPIRIDFSYFSSFSGYAFVALNGCYNSSSNTSILSSGAQYTSTSYAIAIGGNPTSSGQTGVVTVDATNITITWTKYGSPTGTYSFMWVAQ